MAKDSLQSWVCWCIPLILALGKWSQEDLGFKAILCYIARPYLRQNKTKIKHFGLVLQYKWHDHAFKTNLIKFEILLAAFAFVKTEFVYAAVALSIYSPENKPVGFMS
jgi:hypothetical protein